MSASSSAHVARADNWVDPPPPGDNWVDPPPPTGAGGGYYDNEGEGDWSGTKRTKQDGIEYVPARDFEERFDDPSNREPVDSRAGVGFVFLVFACWVVLFMAISIEVIHGGNIWGLGDALGLGGLFPVTFEAPKYIPPRSCGDVNGDLVPDDTLFNCTAGAIAAAGMSSSSGGGDLTTWAVVSPRLEIKCKPHGEKCKPAQCCVDLGPDCAPNAPGGLNTAWELGDGGCSNTASASSLCAEARLPDAETADACKNLVVQANAEFAAGRTPTLYSGALRYPDPNTWPPTVGGQQMSTGAANGVSWGRGSAEVRAHTHMRSHARQPPLYVNQLAVCRNQDPSRIRLSLVDNDINYRSYKQCWAEFGMTEAKKNYFNNEQRLVDMTDHYQTCRLS